MQKEKITSILIGFSFGFLAAAGVFFVPQLFKKKPLTNLPPILNQNQTTPTPAEQVLVLTLPENNQVAREAKITVEGKTKPNSTIVLSTSENDYVVDVDPSGKFEKKIDLTLGPHEIVTTSYLSTGETETVKRIVFYIPEESNVQ